MNESEMGYRGSKSVMFKNITVKEQRVDDSYIGDNSLVLRCTRFILYARLAPAYLMGFERNRLFRGLFIGKYRHSPINCQIGIPSKQINTFSTNNNNLDTGNKLTFNNLNPWFITGFSDAESSFMILVQPRSDSKTKWRIKANFAIGLNEKDTAILEYIQRSLGVGRIYYSGTKVYYRVENFNELQVIIDHFDKYPLVTAKKVDYALFRKCFNLIKLNKHLSEQGLKKIIQIKSALNKGLSEELKEKFKVIANERLEFKFDGIPDPYWVAGFTSGDGSFNIKTTTVRTGKVQLRYAVNLHVREKDVIIGLANYIKTLKDKYSNVEDVKYVHYTKTSVAIQIVNFSDIVDIIIPFFDKYELQGQKKLDFNDFKKVADMMTRKEHLNMEGYNRIIQIKQGMNLKRN